MKMAKIQRPDKIFGLMTSLKLALVSVIALASVSAAADATIPDTDLKKASDTSLIGRYQGSKIVAYQHRSFDSVTLPTSPLVAQPGKRDAHNNIVFAPGKSREIEGEHTRIVYLIPADRSPLEVLRNYEQEITGKGGKVLFNCKKAECGGAPDRASSGGGGDMSLAMFLQPEEDVSAYNEAFSNGYCALTSRIIDQHYLVAELPQQNAFISVLTYMIADGDFCKAFNKRTVAVVDIVQLKQREQKMVVVKADEMAKKISAEGKIALYGIYFDTNKATIRDKSKPTLDEISALLEHTPKLKLLIVGHTDNAGSFSYNLDLSRRRAEAVVKALTAKNRAVKSRLKAVGVSFACPAASNRTEAGRAKNRRVVLVEQ